eukprot:9246299-Ditylum_brightwellii.AAC.1
MERGNIKTSPSCVMRECHQGKRKKKFCNYHEPQEACSAHALYHGTAEALAGLVCQGRQKASQKCSLTGREVKDLNAFVKDRIEEMIKEHNHNMHMMSDFKDLSISSSNKSIQSFISDTSVEGSDNNSCKPAHKK